MSERAARGVLLALCGALLLSGLAVDLPQASGHQFWSDGATYYAMTWSLVEDADLRYEARDLLRVRRTFGSDPQGLFLKRTPDQRPGRPAGSKWRFSPELGFPWVHQVEEPRIHYAKSFAYPLVTAPFVLLLGNRGFLVANGVFLSIAVVAGFLELRRRGAEPLGALLATVAIFGLSVAPIYVLWLTPEILNLAVIALALCCWSRGRPFLSAALFGFACFSKPYNLFAALPLGVAPLLPLLPLRLGELPKRLLESMKRGLVLLGVSLALFATNALLTGEANYQGGERKTFYGRFPEDVTPEGQTITFGNSGQWMTTDYLGPLVEGRDEDKQLKGSGPLRSPEEIRASFWSNLGYFWWGRFSGALGYYPAAVMALIALLASRSKDRESWLAVAAILVSWIFYIVQIPDNWYGGGGTVGNRYFLNLLPLVPYVIPVAWSTLVAIPSAILGLVFLSPVLWSPLSSSLHPGRHAGRAPFRWLPAELTMLNDLSAFTEPWRKKRSVGDTEGDDHKHWPADPRAYYLYFTDDGTNGVEQEAGVEGFRLKGGREAEVLLRSLEPVSLMKFVLVSPSQGRVRLSVGHERLTAELSSRVAAELEADPGPGFRYYDTWVYVLKLSSEGPQAFVRISLDVGSSSQ